MTECAKIGKANVMIPSGDEPFNGIYPSTVCPFRQDFSIDDAALAKPTDGLVQVRGIVGILCNGHAGENWLLSREEQRRVVEITRDTVDKSIVAAGINCENTLQAIEHSRDAKRAGADALLIFPPFS